MSGYLSLVNGTRVAVRDGFVLGRVAGCDLVIEDGKASRRHAKIHVESGVVEIEDLQSSNGTLLNDKPVTRRLLRDGDRVQIGKTVITFHEGELPGGAASGSASASAGAAAAIDDNDLFDAAPVTSVATPRPVAPPAPAPPPPPPAAAPPPPAVVAPVPPPRPATAAPVPAPPRPQAAPPALPPPPQPAPPASTPAPGFVEFEDEVVAIRKPAAPAATAAKPAAGAPVVASQSRVLQFHKQNAGGGLLADDFGQVGGGMRAVFVLGALAIGGGIVWLVIHLMR